MLEIHIFDVDCRSDNREFPGIAAALAKQPNIVAVEILDEKHPLCLSHPSRNDGRLHWDCFRAGVMAWLGGP